MTSYQTVQVVVYSATPVTTDYIAVAPGYTLSDGSVSFGAGAPGSSGTSITVTSVFSKQVGSSNITLDLPAVVTAGSYKSVTVDVYGRVTAGSASLTTADISGDWTSNVSSAQVWGSTVSAQNYVGLPASSATSMTRTSALSFTVGSSNVTFDLSATGVTAGSYVSVTVDDRGRVTAGGTSIGTAQVTGVWTSGVSSGNIQGLGSTWTVSRLSSDQSILANAVWASGFSGLGSIATVSRVSSNATVYAVDLWGSSLSLTGDARIKGVSYTWPAASAAGVLTDNGSGTLSWAAGGGGGAPTTSQYLVLDFDGTLSAERKLVIGSGLTRVDGGSNSTYTVTAFPYYSFCSLSADTGQTNLALQNSEMSFALTANKLYQFKAYYIFRTQATTTGLRFGLTCPAFNVLAATGQVPVAAGGTGGVYHSYITGSGNSVTGTGVALAGVDYLATLEGLINPSANGNLVFQYSTEISASRVTIRAGSHAELWQVTP